MFKWSRNVHKPNAADPLWTQALRQPLFSLLDKTERSSLVHLAQRFQQQKKITLLQDAKMDTLLSARLALLFSLPVLKLGLEWLDGFHEVLIYPEPFRVEDRREDEGGLVHHSSAVHAGQSWIQGPVVLNMLDILDSFDLSGYNLVIHEVAHKLDARGSGYTSGIPAIPLRDVASWEQDLLQVMAEVAEEVALAGEQVATLDAYAASDPAECFAVLSEYFFSAPDLLLQRFPLMYRHLQRFYGQNPAARLATLSAESE